MDLIRATDLDRPGADGQELLAGLRQGTWPRMAGALLVLAVVAVLGIVLGSTQVPLDSTFRVLASHLPWVDADGGVSAATRNIVWNIRLPRVLLAGVVGAALAMSGATYQGVFRNPLADPYLIGVATGAALGATIVIVSGLSPSWNGVSLLPLAAFAGALVSVLVVFGVARTGSAVPTTTLILAGVAVSSLTMAITSYLMIKNTTNAGLIFATTLGGFNTATWARLAWVLPYVIPAGVIILVHARIINVLGLDEDQARFLGIDVERTKLVLLGAASLAAAAAVSVSGTIGFVGLIVPHAIRMAWGADNRRLLPMCIILGAAFLIGADLMARMLDRPSEIPVGIITAFCGVPFFLYLLRRARLGAYP
jgi:iron complex transport system permease protein